MAGTDPLQQPLTLEERVHRLEGDVRDLQTAVERNTAAIETLHNEVRQLAFLVSANARSTEDIAQSRIWRTLAWIGGLLLSMSSFGRRTPAPEPTPDESKDSDAVYRQWIAEFERRDEAAIQQRIAAFTNRPRISVITRTPDVLRAQSWPDWEPCANLESAAGDYVAFLEPGCLLSQDALFHVVELLNREPVTDVIYSDHDSIDDTGRRTAPFFKPDWSPDLLLSMNYIGGLLVFRRALADPTASRSDYDLLLRLIEKTSRIRHIPRILAHVPANRPKRDPESDRRALDGHLARTGSGAWTEPDPLGGAWRVRYPIPSNARVSIIIPAGGNTDLLDACLTSITEKTSYPHYEIIVIDNSTGASIESLVSARKVRYLDWRGKPFNFARICNQAVRQCDSPFLLFLNDDTAVLAGGWIEAMLEHAARPEVGVVGARLLFPDRTIQHAGIVLGLFGNAGHVFKGMPSALPHYFGLDRVVRNVSAVTGACLMTRAEVFYGAGGFDEDFPIDHNDPDLCLRVSAKGYRVIYTPYAEVLHYESLTKRFAEQQPEHQKFCRRWAEAIRNDPFYNPNLTRRNTDYSPRKRGE